MKELGMNFVVSPEFTIKEFFEPEEAMRYLATPTGLFKNYYETGSESLLNPMNMYNLWFTVLSGTNNGESLKDEKLQAYFEKHISRMTWQAEGTMIAKSIEQSIEALERTLLVEYATRNLAYIINYGDNKKSCREFIQECSTEDLSEKICGKQNFTDLIYLRFFIYNYWRGDDFLVQYATGLSEE
jgi:hypothetical protein